ncbi:MAG: DnaA/Hda family protein [Paracoccaceae bacterium]
MTAQLGLNLPARTALGRDDFMIAPSNAIAVAMIDASADWPQGKFVLSGPQGAGKTHLAQVWANNSGARVIAAKDLDDTSVQSLTPAPLVIEDIPDIAQNDPSQRALFHIHNMMLAARQPLLLTGTQAPNLWNMSLPDLQSRIDAAGHAQIELPDDTLLAAVLAKLFNDRHLMPRPDVIPYLVNRIERSFAAAGDVVHVLDVQSLAQKKAMTRRFAQQVLDNRAANET